MKIIKRKKIEQTVKSSFADVNKTKTNPEKINIKTLQRVKLKKSKPSRLESLTEVIVTLIHDLLLTAHTQTNRNTHTHTFVSIVCFPPSYCCICFGGQNIER